MAVDLTTVFGTAFSITGVAVEGVTVQATLKATVLYNGEHFIGNTIVTARTNELGYWEMDLADNESMRYFNDSRMGQVYYQFTFRGPGIKLIENRIVRKAETAEYNTLEFVQMEGDGEGFTKARNGGK